MPDKLKKQGRQTTLWESDCGIVPLTLEDQSSETKPGNAGAGKAARLSRDPKPTSSTRSGGSTVLDRLERITCRAKSHPHEAFNNVFTLLTVELLWYAFRRLKRGKSPGVDGVTMEDYEENLQENLLDLQDRLHRGTYRPQPSVRKDIPKGNGKTRPLGIATVEDKIVQRAIVMILEPIYEADFSDVSYGFRPGRSCHAALATLGQIIATKKVSWISDADIKGFFDNVSHERLVELLQQRISDPRMLDLIVRFLKCGVMIAGRREATDDGVPQGACLSPLLANVYLHYVLDQWFENDVKPRMRGEAYLIRYADDFICAFECESDARAFQSVLPKRLGRFSLEVAEEKTKLLRFGRFAERDSTRCGEGAPGTFDFLGFTHYCGHARSGRFKLKRRTSSKKMRAKLLDLKTWFHSMLSTPIEDVWSKLNAKLRGHYQYYGINDNWPSLLTYRERARRMARRHLSRRSQKTRVTWDDFKLYITRHGLANPTKLTDLIAMGRAAGNV
jgi:group II intron reverse transcriptase/maturase